MQNRNLRYILKFVKEATRIFNLIAYPLLVVALLVALFSQIDTSTMRNLSLTDVEILTDIVNNIAIISALFVGGLWAYYQFEVGRTFAAKPVLGTSFEIMEERDDKFLVHVDLTVENVGTTRVYLAHSLYTIYGISLDSDNVSKELLYKGEFEIPTYAIPVFNVSTIERKGFFNELRLRLIEYSIIAGRYLEPTQKEFLYQILLLPKGLEYFVVEVVLVYGRFNTMRIQRSFTIKPSIRQS